MDFPSAMRLLLLLVVCCALLAPPPRPDPPQTEARSDQRLAELETLLALAKMNNRKYVTLPVGFGLIDVKQIGRRKRALVPGSSDRDALQEADEYNLGELLSALTSKAENEDSGLEDNIFPADNLSLQQDLKEEQQASRLKDGQVLAGVRPPSPAILYGLRSLPRRRYF